MSGVSVDYQFYGSKESQRAVLRALLQRLLSENVPASDIVLLSRLKLENSVIATFDRDPELRFLEYSASVPERSRVPVFRFSTIQAFKGMESPVVVLCDVDQASAGEPQSLLYVGMSRARSQLCMVVSENLRTVISERIRQKLSSAWSVQK